MGSSECESGIRSHEIQGFVVAVVVLEIEEENSVGGFRDGKDRTRVGGVEGDSKKSL